jgi:hypothetical protein
MPLTVVVHLHNEDPVLGEVDALPASTDTMVLVRNPRRRDGKDVQFLSNEVVTVIWPINQLTFIEVLPGEGEERIITFVRD